MVMKPKSKAHEPENQSEKFKKASRELGCDEDEAAFEERLRKIAKAPPPKPEKKKPRTGGAGAS
jgi:hypothetical protein